MRDRPRPFELGDPATVLQDLARVLAVWRQRSWVATTEAALRQWVYSTAARAPRLADADTGIKMLRQLGLANRSADGLFVPDPALVPVLGPAGDIDAFPLEVRNEVFGRLLASEFGQELWHVLSFLLVGTGTPRVPWRSVPKADRGAPGWLWLQQLGLAVHVDEELRGDPILLPYVADTPPAHQKISQLELDERVRQRNLRGERAEEYVCRLEVARLTSAGATDLADGVVRVSITDVGAGYDIRSYDLSGSPRFIEVKSSAGPRRAFFISQNELATARSKGSAFWLAWVGWAALLPAESAPVVWFQDPARLLVDAPSHPWRIEPAMYEVTLVDSDERYCTPP